MINVLVDEVIGIFAGGFNGNAVGNGLNFGKGGDFAPEEGLLHAGGTGGLDAVDPAFGVNLFYGEGDTGDETAAADGNNNGIKVGKLLGNFKADGGLPGDDINVVKGVDEGIAVLVAELKGFVIGIVIDAVYHNNLGAVALGGFNFRDGGAVGEADIAFNAVTGGGEGNALGVVAGRAGDDTARLFIICKIADFEIGAADFKRAGNLQVFGFEVDVGAVAYVGGIDHIGFADNIF